MVDVAVETLVALAGGRLSFGETRDGFLNVPVIIEPDRRNWPALLRRVKARHIVVEYQLCLMPQTLVEDFLAACYSALLPDGILTIGEPDAGHPNPEYQTWMNRFPIVSMFTSDRLQKLIFDAGFTDVDLVEHYDGPNRFIRGSSTGPASLIARSSVNDLRFLDTVAFSSLVVQARRMSADMVIPDHYGHGNTARLRRAVDWDGRPIPWVTYPALLYLNQIDFASCKVFEYGCGASTLYWARRAHHVFAVEHNAVWFNEVSSTAPPNCSITHATGADYVNAIQNSSPFDIIVIDGRWRYDCASVAVDHLSKEGMIILDNSERYPAITEYLRSRSLLQVDFIGMGPINRVPWATSLFFTRSFAPRPAAQNWPAYVPGLEDSIERNPCYEAQNCPGSF